MSDRMLSDEILLGLIKKNGGGGGGGGTSDYSQLSNKPQINGVTLSGDKSASDLSLASLDANGKVPSSQLPSYVDDVVEGYYDASTDRFYEESTFETVITPVEGKSWVDIPANKSYRWTGSVYVRVDEGVQIGETSDTAYAGNKGKANADAISAITNGESINNFAGVEIALSNMQSLDGVVNPSDSVGEDKNLYIKLSGSVPSAMKVTSLKFEVTARRGGGTGMIEYSRLGFYDADGNKYSWPQGTTWSSNVRTAENDPIGSSKMLQYEIPAITTINLPEGEYIDASVYKLYGWNTGTYTGENCQRDPISWKLYLSEDKTNYILRDERSNQTITTSRSTLAFKDEFNTLPPEFPYISDIFYKKGGMWLKDAFAQQSEVDAIKDGQSINSFSDVESALSNKQGKLTAGDYISIANDGTISVTQGIGVYDVYSYKIEGRSSGNQYYTNVIKSKNGVQQSSNTYYNTQATTPINIDDRFTLKYVLGSELMWHVILLTDSNEHSAGEDISWKYNVTKDFTETFNVSQDSSIDLATKGDIEEALAEKLPDAPTTDGTYNLQVTVSSGTPTYSWVSTT